MRKKAPISEQMLHLAPEDFVAGRHNLKKQGFKAP
jgi:hypothetical protein